MPTGSGKTILAAELVRLKLLENANLRILFLVPTRVLVDQQALVVERWCPGAVVRRYHGGLGTCSFDFFQVMVSTPAAFRKMQANNKDSFSWATFSLVIFDEVHHVLKEHPYRLIAQSLLAWHRTNDDHTVQVLGLSASLTYDVHESKIKTTLNRLCTELSTEIMISPSVEELEAGGYVQQGGRSVQVMSTSHLPEGITRPSSRKPHSMHETFMNRIKVGCATYVAMAVMNVVTLLETMAMTCTPAFRSPLSCSKLSSWELYAYTLRRGSTGATHDLFASLECWYVALRVLIQTWEEECQIVIQWLKMNSAMAHLPPALQRDPNVIRFQKYLENEDNLRKLGSLQSQVHAKKEEYGTDFKCIVFVQQRFTAMVVAHFLNQVDSTLQAGFVASRGSSVTPSFKVTRECVSHTIDSFKDGRCSVLVATSVIEEGFDVPQANVVILYDHLKDSVELCQRFGRARALKCSIVVLEERHDRPLVFLEQIRQQQDELVHTYTPLGRKGIDNDLERKRQTDRERSAYKKILCDLVKCTDRSISAFNEYVAATKGRMDEIVEVDQDVKFTCQLTYASILREIQQKATADTKKGAKAECCKQILLRLRSETRT